MTDSGKRTVYSVSAGEYSDYRVMDLFEDKADAEANAARNPHDWYVQEFALHPPGSRDVLQQVIEYGATTWVSQEGKILDYVHVRPWYQWPEDADDPNELTSSVRESTFSMVSAEHGARKFQPEWPLGAKVYEVMAWTGDESRARKAVQERAAKVASIVIDGGDPTQPAG